MKNLTKHLTSLFGIIALSAIMVFFVTCQQEPETEKKPDPKIPSEFQNTTWQNKNGDTLTFSETTIKIKVSSGEYTYTLKESVYIKEQDWSVLYFKNTDQLEAITVQNQKVNLVNFNCIGQSYRGGLNQWTEDDGSSVNNVQYDDVTINDMVFKYYEKYDGYAVTEYTGKNTVVVIPKTVNNVKVTFIGYKAFASKKLTSVTIPDSITHIELKAFINNQLTSLTIPDSVIYIGSGAFLTNKLTSVTLGYKMDININNIDIYLSFAYSRNNSAAGTYTRSSPTSQEWTKQ
jgi:hypothetical protein